MAREFLRSDESVSLRVKQKREIVRRVRELDRWLDEQDVDVRIEQKHLDEGTRERIYWHYGYMVALRDALKAFGAPD